jgi:pilus assembly protein CpaB
MAAKRYSIIFYAAILVALLSTFGVYRVLEKTKENARVVTGPVVVAQKEMAEGTAIDRLAVVVAQWPVYSIPAGAFTSIDSVAGRVTRMTVFKGEVLVPGRLAPDGTGPGLAVKITPGKRAVSFRINDVSGIAGLIQPDSRVDIVVVMEGGPEKGRMAKLFLENMRILAIGSAPQPSADGRPMNATVATVEATPSEGEQLSLVTTQAQIQLMLRGYGDPESAKTTGATTAQIIKGLNQAATVSTEQPRAEVRRVTPVRRDVAPQTPPPAPIAMTPTQTRVKPDSSTVTLIRGQQVSKQTFAADSVKSDSLRSSKP